MTVGRPARRTAVSVLLLGVLTTATLGGCARTAFTPRAPGGVDYTTAQAALDAVKIQVWGTNTDREAGVRYQHTSTQTILRDCMAKAGYTYVIPEPADTPVPVELIAPGDLTAFAPTTDAGWGLATARSTAQRVANTPNPQLAGLSVAEQLAYGDKMTECGNGQAAYADAHMPADAPRLSIALADALRPIDRAFAQEKADYVTCMARNGTPIPASGPDEVDDWTKLKLSAESAYGASVEGSEEFTAAQAYEIQTATADKNCRQTLYETAVSAAYNQIEQFNDDYHDDLADVAADWAAVPR